MQLRMNLASQISQAKTGNATMEWAKNYVSKLNDGQLALLQKMYADHQAKLKASEDEKKKKEMEELKMKAQQQAILDSLTQQIPIMVDVLRSSTSPDSQPSSSSSVMSSTDEDQITVKDVLIGKINKAQRQSSPNSSKPYTPRGIRERVLFDEHLYVFDKCSYDSKKRFFRCERKNTCPARIHTPFDAERVIHKVQVHNHPPPTTFDLAHYNIDYGKVKSGHILSLNGPQQTKNLLPPSLLTPKSDLEDETLSTKTEQKNASTMNILLSMTNNCDGRKPITLRLPDLFNKISEMEIHDMEMTLTKFLLENRELRTDLISRNGDLPVFFPNAHNDELVLFVADQHENDSVFQMIRVSERNEKSIRQAIQEHLQKVSNRSLMMNISSKINVPLSQQMIDQWRTEEFIRLDSSKPNFWKIHHVSKLQD